MLQWLQQLLSACITYLFCVHVTWIEFVFEVSINVFIEWRRNYMAFYMKFLCFFLYFNRIIVRQNWIAPLNWFANGNLWTRICSKWKKGPHLIIFCKTFSILLNYYVQCLKIHFAKSRTKLKIEFWMLGHTGTFEKFFEMKFKQ